MSLHWVAAVVTSGLLLLSSSHATVQRQDGSTEPPTYDIEIQLSIPADNTAGLLLEYGGLDPITLQQTCQVIDSSTGSVFSPEPVLYSYDMGRELNGGWNTEGDLESRVVIPTPATYLVSLLVDEGSFGSPNESCVYSYSFSDVGRFIYYYVGIIPDPCFMNRYRVDALEEADWVIEAQYQGCESTLFVPSASSPPDAESIDSNSAFASVGEAIEAGCVEPSETERLVEGEEACVVGRISATGRNGTQGGRTTFNYKLVDAGLSPEDAAAIYDDGAFYVNRYVELNMPEDGSIVAIVGTVEKGYGYMSGPYPFAEVIVIEATDQITVFNEI